jgi:hypothetical protein
MKSFKQIFLAGLVTISMVSCEGFLDTNPYNSISNDLALSNYSNIVKATNGLYSPLKSSGYLGARMVIAGDVMADNVGRSTVKNSSRYVEEFNLTLGPSVGYYSGLWTTPYYVINSACKVIDALESGKFDKQNATDEQVNQLQGEALFIRAMCHFDLVRSFAQHYTINSPSVAPNSNGQGGHLGVPIITKHDITNFPARNTVDQVYSQIINDLTSAFPLITFDKGRNYASQNAVKALLARVYLYKQDWTNAAKYAEEVITSGEYSLSQGVNVEGYWLKELGEETVFQLTVKPTEDYFPGNESLGSLYNIGTEFPYSDLIVQNDLYSLYADGDLRKNLFFTDSNNEVRVKKYLPKTGSSSPYENNLKVFRIAEMYLISAEANITVNPTLAQTRFNELRASRGLGIATLNQASLELERRLELACEGHRLFDLARWGRHNIRTNNMSPTVNYPSHLYILPIPASEIQRNSNILQNTGY